VKIPGWRYPAVFDTQTGQARFDNYGGRWGEQSQLDRFLQAYAVEKTKLEARKKGHTVTEHSLTDGCVFAAGVQFLIFCCCTKSA
jgi:hypothetical protein